MRAAPQLYEIDWQGITLSVTFAPNFSGDGFRKLYGYSMANIEVQSIRPERVPLPISRTGYRSLFLPLPQVEEMGGVLALVRNWLDEAAAKPTWKAQAEAARQMSLF